MYDAIMRTRFRPSRLSAICQYQEPTRSDPFTTLVDTLSDNPAAKLTAQEILDRAQRSEE